MKTAPDFIPQVGRFCQLLLLALALWAVNFSRFALGALQEAMRIDLGLSDNQIALLQGPIIAVPIVLGSVPVGLYIDRYRRAPVVPAFLALTLAACVATALGSTFPMLLAARFLAGMSLGALLVTTYAMTADLYAPAQRGRATMVIAMGEVGAPMAAFALGGMLLVIGTSMAAGSTLAGWRWADERRQVCKITRSLAIRFSGV